MNTEAFIWDWNQTVVFVFVLSSIMGALSEQEGRVCGVTPGKYVHNLSCHHVPRHDCWIMHFDDAAVRHQRWQNFPPLLWFLDAQTFGSPATDGHVCPPKLRHVTLDDIYSRGQNQSSKTHSINQCNVLMINDRSMSKSSVLNPKGGL